MGAHFIHTIKNQHIMAYAFITKKIVKRENVTRNNKLKWKLERELLPEEVIYDEYTYIKYICVFRPLFSDYEIRITKIKDEAIFYTEKELKLIKYRLKGRQYIIIDTKTNEEIERIPAAINIALEPKTVGEVSCLSEIK
jgi:hypothetical protein